MGFSDEEIPQRDSEAETVDIRGVLIVHLSILSDLLSGYREKIRVSPDVCPHHPSSRFKDKKVGIESYEGFCLG